MLQAPTLDAVVVGGGPAGCAFAIELARRGRSVAILERTRSAEHKVCGEFLSRETVTLLDYLGVDVRAFGSTSVDRLRLVSGERCAEIALPFVASALSRYHMDEALLTEAQRAGVRVVRGARVVSVEGDEDSGIAKTSNEIWRGRVIGLATGKHGLHGIKRPRGSIVGFKTHLSSPGARQIMSSMVQLAFFAGGYAGACSIEDGVLSVGWVIEAALLQTVGSSWLEQSAFLSERSSFMAALLDKAGALLNKPVSTAAIPYGFLRVEPIGPTVYPLGDQLAVVPSFTGDGLAIALSSGIAAARAVAAGKPAAVFQREMITKLRPQFFIAGALGRLLQTPALSGLTVSAARILPGVAKQMVNATRLRGFDHLADRYCGD